jgi:IS30 family transposase
MNSYHHLSHQERSVLMMGLKSGKSLRYIANLLGRYPSTLTRELKRNSMTVSSYNACKASDAYFERRLLSVKPHKLLANQSLAIIVQNHLLRNKWSPEQISAWLKKEDEHTLQVSHETIYSYIYAHPKGELRKLLIGSLRNSKSKRGQRGSPDSCYSSLKIQPEQLISQRPQDINSREVAGHWEGDLVVGAMNKSCVGTLVERKTGFVIICKMRNKSAEAVREGFEINMKTLPQFLRASMTYDRGAEMSQHAIMSKNLDMKIYFADRNAPWQRGSSENINGLIRQYLPKGTDLLVHSQSDLDEIAFSLNHRPRKRYGFRTPQEMMERELEGGVFSVALDS